MEQYDRFGERLETEEEFLCGHSQSELIIFVEKNGGRYYEIFKKNKSKKAFFHINWAAMFLSVYWMFYRKMYKEGILFLVFIQILSALLATTALFATHEEILALKKQREDFSVVLSEMIQISPADSALITEKRSELKQQENRVFGKAAAIILISSLVVMVFFGLYADCLYRNYVFRKIRFSDAGGTSWIAVLGALGLILLSNMVGNSINSIIINCWI